MQNSELKYYLHVLYLYYLMHNHRCYIWPSGCKDLGARKLKFVISLGLYYQQEYRHWIASYESSA